MLIYCIATWNILQTFGTFCAHLGHFFRFWYHARRKIWQPCSPPFAALCISFAFLWPEIKIIYFDSCIFGFIQNRLPLRFPLLQIQNKNGVLPANAKQKPVLPANIKQKPVFTCKCKTKTVFYLQIQNKTGFYLQIQNKNRFLPAKIRFFLLWHSKI
jgi:hypothetical protein